MTSKEKCQECAAKDAEIERLKNALKQTSIGVSKDAAEKIAELEAEIERLKHVERTLSLFNGWDKAAEALKEKDERIAELEAAIDIITTPRLWSKEMDRAWHKSIPDVPLAFHELKKAATKRAKEEGDE